MCVYCWHIRVTFFFIFLLLLDDQTYISHPRRRMSSYCFDLYMFLKQLKQLKGHLLQFYTQIIQITIISTVFTKQIIQTFITSFNFKKLRIFSFCSIFGPRVTVKAFGQAVVESTLFIRWHSVTCCIVSTTYTPHDLHQVLLLLP